ncbi:50S ribosomal protein L4, partial [Erythrobacter sp. HI0037]
GGTARHGDRGAPIFIGGGRADGARKRDFEQSLNKKVRALGLKMALSSKAKDGLVVVDSLELKDAKTKALVATFGKNGWSGKVLVIDGESVNDGFSKAARNIPGVNVLPAMGANVYDILKHDTLVLTKDAVEKLEARFNG